MGDKAIACASRSAASAEPGVSLRAAGPITPASSARTVTTSKDRDGKDFLRALEPRRENMGEPPKSGKGSPAGTKICPGVIVRTRRSGFARSRRGVCQMFGFGAGPPVKTDRGVSADRATAPGVVDL
ncbi:hypothetical protein GCM10017790_67950 [Amycolatopsis oliviviridis]|uniref:Uncharacterized protein n=1 Tax=Amycolatopsis oliviviridis TaxID=1471590 RepID=A0ABQ3M2A6_9PSEU|nr:hypothetical protein GCM10017790_67950 [Amycolatopsis oliviviridis]